MKRKIKYGSLYDYLAQSGVLNGSNESAIQTARKEYWRLYKLNWRKQSRTTGKEFVILLNKKELQIISEAAQKHKRSRSAFIKIAALAYITRQFIVPDILAVNTIRLLLIENYTALQQLFEENLLPFEIGRIVLQRIEDLEHEVLTSLHNPLEVSINSQSFKTACNGH